MRQLLRGAAPLLLAQAVLSADSAPTLEWVKTLGGSGVSQVRAAAADANGNFYIVGTTSSLDFPTTASAAQRTAGGSPLVRINAATAIAEKLFPPGSALHVIAVNPQNPARLYAAAADGVFGSLDAGSTWSPLATIAAGSNISSLAVDPSNGNVVYAATATQGIWKSIDGGITWNVINSGIAANSSGAIVALHVWIDRAGEWATWQCLPAQRLRSQPGAYVQPFWTAGEREARHGAGEPRQSGELRLHQPTRPRAQYRMIIGPGSVSPRRCGLCRPSFARGRCASRISCWWKSAARLGNAGLRGSV
jgi:hypothetical protein